VAMAGAWRRDGLGSCTRRVFTLTPRCAKCIRDIRDMPFNNSAIRAFQGETESGGSDGIGGSSLVLDRLDRVHGSYVLMSRTRRRSKKPWCHMRMNLCIRCLKSFLP
jgi:hypothetical protein